MLSELARRARTLAGASLLSVAATACYTPGYNTYATPRVTPQRKIAAGAHVQVAGYAGEIAGQKNQKHFAPTLPGVSGRVGLGGRWDMGFQAGLGFGFYTPSALRLGGDLKWLVLPGEALDLALDPGFRFTNVHEEIVSPDGYVTTDGVNHYELDAPVLAGINVSESLVVVLSPGVVAGWYSEQAVPFDHAVRGPLVDGIAPRVGIGLDVRLDESLAIHPEATFVYTTEAANQRMIYTFGFGFHFGNLPKTLRASDAAKPRSPESAE